MITFQHKITKITVLPELNSLQDVVYEVAWYSEARTELFATRQNGTTKLSSPDPDNFIEYNELTEEEVLSWLPPIDTESLERVLNDMILRNQQNTIVTETKPLPWGDDSPWGNIPQISP